MGNSPGRMRSAAGIKISGIIIYSYLLLLSLSYSHRNSAYQSIVTILFGVLILTSIKIISLLSKKCDSKQILLGILLLGCAIRFLWAIFVPTEPFSDFKVFYLDNAIKLSQGFPALTKNMGYVLLLSLGYRVYPAIISGKLINAAISSVSIYFIYLIGSKLDQKKTGLIGAFLYSILPSEILMVSVLGTEVLATALGIITAYFIFSSRAAESIRPINALFLAGFFFGLGYTVRASFAFYLPAILLWIMVTSGLEYKKIITSIGKFAAGLSMGVFVFLIGYFISTHTFTFEPIRTQDSFPILSGTNINTSGTWSQEDWELYLSWPADQRNVIALQEARRRIFSNPVGFVKQIPQKFLTLIGPNDYGNYWSLRNIDYGKINIMIGLASQSFYVIILLYGLLSIKNNPRSVISITVLTLTLLTLIPHIFLEVQPRYHHYLLPFLILGTAGLNSTPKQEIPTHPL